MTTQQPPRVSGTPSGDEPVPGAGWATQAPQQQQPRPAAPQWQPQHAYPAQPYTPQHRPTAERVRDRDAARAKVGITAVVAVAALLGTGAAVVAATGLGSSTTTASSTTSSSDTSSSSSSSSTGTTVASSNQSSVASTSGS